MFSTFWIKKQRYLAGLLTSSSLKPVVCIWFQFHVDLSLILLTKYMDAAAKVLGE